MEKKILVNINWMDDEIIEIQCPYCKEPVSVGIYRDFEYKCICGKRFVMSQTTDVYEVIEQ